LDVDLGLSCKEGEIVMPVANFLALYDFIMWNLVNNSTPLCLVLTMTDLFKAHKLDPLLLSLLHHCGPLNSKQQTGQYATNQNPFLK
jgi:hypothetical protein